MNIGMLLARRRSMMNTSGGSLLPEGYTQFTWLTTTATGGQLDTGIAIDGTKAYKLETKVMWHDLSTLNRKVGSAEIYFGVGFNAYWMFCMGNGIGSIGAAPTVDTEYNIEIGYSGTTASFKVDNGNQYDVTDTSVTGLNFLLFSHGKTAGYSTKMSFGETTIKLDGVVVAHLIPCKDGSDNYGMYDTVTSTFIAVNNNSKFTGS